MAQNICRTGKLAKDGLNRDILIRYLISRDQFWWKTANSPWKLNLEHPWVQEKVDPRTGERSMPYEVSDLRTRALNLSEYEITHSHFGLSFVDLMHLDPATFEEIEERVHKLAQEQSKHMEKFANAGKEAKTNFLASKGR